MHMIPQKRDNRTMHCASINITGTISFHMGLITYYCGFKGQGKHTLASSKNVALDFTRSDVASLNNIALLVAKDKF